MRAVNLIPRDSRRRGSGGGGLSIADARPYVILGVLAIAVLYVTLYVLAGNQVSSRQAQLTSLNQQIAEVQAQGAHLTSYSEFEQLAQARAQTVRQIAATRFNWDAALTNLSKVVPTNTSLTSLVATVAPGSGSSGGSSGGSGLRSAINAPAFELSGCTGSENDVARLMSRLRLINGVTRVTLSDAVRSVTSSSGSGAPAAGSSTTAGATCSNGSAAFDVVVFFQPIAGALTTTTAGGTAPSGTSSTTSGTSAPTTTTPAAGSTPTPTTTTTTPSGSAP